MNPQDLAEQNHPFAPAESEFLFAIDPEHATVRLTSYGGGLLIRTLRWLVVAHSAATKKLRS